MGTMFQSMWRDQRGTTAIEYGLLAALISIAALAGMQQIGETLEQAYYGVIADNLDASN